MSRLRKLAAMRPAEIVERVTQALAVRRDRSLGSPRTRSLAPAAFVARRLAGGIDSAEALLARFRERPSRFFAGLDDPAATARALARVRPDAPAEARAEAEAVLAGRVRLFDRRWDVGLRPDWHVEPLSGVRYPQVHWSRIDYLDPAVGGEYKLIWELARQQQILTLARAHAFDGDARWAEAALAHVEDWIHANPPGLGIHWASSLELAFRVQSWIWALHAFRGTPALTPERFARILASIETQGLHIERYLSTYYSPNTHLTGEALALYTIGVAFPELTVAEGWRRRGRDVLARWAAVQIRADGTYFEQSTAYQRYTVDFYQQWAALAERSGEPVPAAVLARLESAVDHLAALTLPNGLVPLMGDDDGGRTWPVDARPRADVRPAYALAAARFGRGDLKTLAGDAVDEVAWVLGPAGLDAYAAVDATPDPRTAHAFDDGGLYVSRSAATAMSDYVLIDCGPHGVLNCGHAHADLLSVVVAVDGQDVLVDPGTFTYSSDPVARNRYRTASAHNTVTLDGEGASRPDRPFQWARITHGSGAQWRAWDGVRAFAGAHAGFDGGAGHRRALVHVPGLLVAWADRITGAAAGSTATAHLHLPAGVEARVEPVEPGPAAGSARPARLHRVAVGDRARLHLMGAAGVAVVPDTVSASYRSEADSQTVQARLGDGPLLTLVTAPDARVEPWGSALRVRRGDRVWAVQAGSDAGPAGSGEAGPLWRTDAELAAVRLAPDGEAVEAVVVAGGLFETAEAGPDDARRLALSGQAGIHRIG